MNAIELSPDMIAEAVAWRRHLHMHPETAYAERQTGEFVATRLAEFGLTVHRGLGGTGVVGTLTRGSSRRTIGIRADMDALPIQERSDVPYVSRNTGVMHACGHDGHVAIALAAARACAGMQDLDGTVHFIFQPAEENEGGARRMIEEGLFNLFPCESVYALHNWPGLPLGSCMALDGAMMAALALFEIELIGRGCHGAMPHEGTDPIVAACNVVTALQTLVSRNMDPLKCAVVSVTQVRGGDTWNVIPEACVIRGTTRWFDEQVGELIEQRVTQVSTSIAQAMGCQAKIRYDRRFPATINNPNAARIVRAVASSVPVGLSVLDAPPSMSSEDFAVMLQAVPGCYVWLGAGKPTGSYALHSPHYDFNDESLSGGVRLWLSLIRNVLCGA